MYNLSFIKGNEHNLKIKEFNNGNRTQLIEDPKI